MPVVVETVAGVREIIAELKATAVRDGGPARVALVPTMGALHSGHLSLVRRARQLGSIVVVSIFVNPLQFAPTEDLDRYPRTRDDDVLALDGLADVVFAPSATEMYPSGPTETRVTAGPVGNLYEGASRPGHFDGVLTVVAKLFNIVGPDVAVFGQKDAQQGFLVRQMVGDLNFAVTIDVADTVREGDGLALSSRNRFLGESERVAAVALSRALSAAATVAGSGGDLDAAVAAARAVLAGEPDVKMDYLVAVDPATFLPLSSEQTGSGEDPAQGERAAIVPVAAGVGATRLIDNVRIGFRVIPERRVN